MSDEALLDRLREIIATIDPVPSGIRLSGRAAFWTADRPRGPAGTWLLSSAAEDYCCRGGADDFR